MNNTPLQQLRDKLNEHLKTMVGKQPYDNGYKSALVDVMYLIDEFKEEEKQAILEARVTAPTIAGLGTKKEYEEEAEQYYNEKYKNNDKERPGDNI